MYTNGYKKRCYSILADLMVDYKEQVLIIGIKVNMQYLICHIPQKKRVDNPIIEDVNLPINLELA